MACHDLVEGCFGPIAEGTPGLAPGRKVPVGVRPRRDDTVAGLIVAPRHPVGFADVALAEVARLANLEVPERGHQDLGRLDGTRKDARVQGDGAGKLVRAP